MCLISGMSRWDCSPSRWILTPVFAQVHNCSYRALHRSNVRLKFRLGDFSSKLCIKSSIFLSSLENNKTIELPKDIRLQYNQMISKCKLREFKYTIFGTHKACHFQINIPCQNLPGLDRDSPETQLDWLEYATKASRGDSVH
jgi:hypothetical protein